MTKNLFGRICCKVKKECERLFWLIFFPHQYLKKAQSFLEVYEKIINSRVKLPSDNESEKISCVIFSKDRPLQLLSLVSSFQHFVSGPCPVHLIYNTSEKRFEKAYQEFFQDHGKFFSTITDDSKEFKGALMNTLASLRSQKVFFLVDDIIFKKRINISDFLSFPTETFVPSLRMGNHLSYCYPHSKKQPLPEFKTLEDHSSNGDFIFWKWNKGKFDWSYPLSVDGHIFDRQEFFYMAEYLDYKAPNSLESELQKFNGIFNKRFGVAMKDSVIMNIPCNIVQKELYNVHGNFHQDDLLEVWRQGKQIDYKKFENFKNESVHQEVDLEFISR